MKRYVISFQCAWVHPVLTNFHSFRHLEYLWTDRQLAHNASMVVNAKCTQRDAKTQCNNTTFNTYYTVQPCHIQVNKILQLQQYIQRVKLPSMHHHYMYIAADTAPTNAHVETDSTTVGSWLSKSRLFELLIIRTLGRRHVFGSSGSKIFWSLEFCSRRKQSCCMNNFSQMLQLPFQPVWDLDHNLQRPSKLSEI